MSRRTEGRPIPVMRWALALVWISAGSAKWISSAPPSAATPLLPGLLLEILAVWEVGVAILLLLGRKAGPLLSGVTALALLVGWISLGAMHGFSASCGCMGSLKLEVIEHLALLTGLLPMATSVWLDDLSGYDPARAAVPVAAHRR